jgi:hypothetical protein
LVKHYDGMRKIKCGRSNDGEFWFDMEHPEFGTIIEGGSNEAVAAMKLVKGIEQVISDDVTSKEHSDAIALKDAQIAQLREMVDVMRNELARLRNEVK